MITTTKTSCKGIRSKENMCQDSEKAGDQTGFWIVSLPSCDSVNTSEIQRRPYAADEGSRRCSATQRQLQMQARAERSAFEDKEGHVSLSLNLNDTLSD